MSTVSIAYARRKLQLMHVFNNVPMRATADGLECQAVALVVESI